MTKLLEVLRSAESDDAACGTFVREFTGRVRLPVDAHVVGEPVQVIELRYDGNPRRGVTASCRGQEADYIVSIADVRFAKGSEADLCAQTYRTWLGLAPEEPPILPPKTPKADVTDALPGQVIDLAVLAIRDGAVRCRILGTARELTFRTPDHWRVVPGEIATARVRKSWSYARHPYISGGVERIRLEVPALGLVPLRLTDEGLWEPAAYGWGPEDEIEEWAIPFVSGGPRREFEMAQVLPGSDPNDPDSDPITDAVELHTAGAIVDAHKILMDLLAVDLRCLDAHAHLGNFAFDPSPDEALRHYEAGLRIGDLSLPPGFDGVLPWGMVDNRPFLRCMHGCGLSLWRLGRTDEAIASFTRQLSLNPPDNQGARFVLEDIRAGRRWEECREHER